MRKLQRVNIIKITAEILQQPAEINQRMVHQIVVTAASNQHRLTCGIMHQTHIQISSKSNHYIKSYEHISTQCIETSGFSINPNSTNSTNIVSIKEAYRHLWVNYDLNYIAMSRARSIKTWTQRIYHQASTNTWKRYRIKTYKSASEYTYISRLSKISYFRTWPHHRAILV